MEQLASGLFSVNVREWLKGLKVAVVTALLGFLYQLYATPGFGIDTLIAAAKDWKSILNVAVVAGIGYIVTTFVTGKKKPKQ